jgi:hypothetical protein
MSIAFVTALKKNIIHITQYISQNNHGTNVKVDSEQQVCWAKIFVTS